MNVEQNKKKINQFYKRNNSYIFKKKLNALKKINCNIYFYKK